MNKSKLCLVVNAMLLALVFLASHAAHSREIVDKKLTARQLYQILADHPPGEKLTFRQCSFSQDLKESSYLSGLDDYPDESANGYADLLARELINFDLEFANCKFNPDEPLPFLFRTFYFNGSIRLENCTGYGASFDRCIFKYGLKANDVSFNYLEFRSCTLFEEILLSDATITQLKFFQDKFVRNDGSRNFGIRFEDLNRFTNYFVEESEFLDYSTASKKHLGDTLHSNSILHLKFFDADHFTMRHCVFNCFLNIENFSVEKTFEFADNTIIKKLIFSNVPNIPVEASVIRYSLIKGKIGVAYDLGDNLFRFIKYDNEKEYSKFDLDRPWIETDVEKRIIPVYSKLLAIYNTNTDIESYNECYNQLKKIEKTASKVKFQTEGQFIYWFRWKMDEFLEAFSAYGTDPVLSLINSFYVILIFSLIYLIFPSEEDNLWIVNIQSALHRYIAHFSASQKHFFTADEMYEKELAAANSFREQVLSNVATLPPVIKKISMPFYYSSYTLARIRHRVRSVIKFNIYQEWRGLNTWGRVKTTTLLSLNFFSFLLWGLIMRVLNSLALSFNAFVTLGYGEIEAKGIARYFCVMEGVLGWFLLSIFSVSLISQILQ
jgi:hypothetical protein